MPTLSRRSRCPPPTTSAAAALLLVDALVREVHGLAEVLPETTTGGKRITIRLPLAPVAA
ncbi:hypothetical protein ABT275_38415 [Streptomyces sp. NPDC001185]|uniref:hypothetical protein n=1 Tax=Streptomyces sp. NPDC001185 TaxID=3154380 RepID=UPI003317870D